MVARISADIPLPCGCKIENTVNVVGTFEADQITHLLEHAAASLSYWATLRARSHRCELVSDTNPTGFDREAAHAAAQEPDDGN